MNPKISVIMSVHNGMPYLKTSVESIMKQSYKNFEFIIVNDASADSSWDYLKSIKDKRIKLLKNIQNLGLATSLNKALRYAQGDFIARMDADDISLRNRLEEQLKFLENHPKIDVIGAWVDLIDENSKIIGEKKYPTENAQMQKALRWYTPIIHPTLMSKAIFFKELNGYDPEFDMAEDYELLLRAKNCFVMANITQKLLLWRLADQRRSRENMHEMDKIDLKIKWKYFRKGYFGPFYLITILKKFAMTYVVPTPIKLKISQLLKLA